MNASITMRRDDELMKARLNDYLRLASFASLAFLGCYVGAAVALRSVAFAGMSGAVVLHIISLLLARAAAARGNGDQAARITAASILVMTLVATPFAQFAGPALVVLPLAGVAVMQPYLSLPALLRYMIAALVVGLYVVIMCELVPPLVPSPPLLVHGPLTAAAAVGGLALTVHMMWSDTRRLHNSLDEARRAVKLRDDFLSVASHELRTPLAALRMQVDRLALGAPQDPKALRIQRQTERMANLVELLLDVSRMQTMRLDRIDDVSLASCARNALNDLAATLTRAGCTVHTSLDDSARGAWDPVRVEQAISNLVENAAKYGAGKPIDVHVRREGDVAVLDVVDRGIGIAPADLERVFAKFERAVSGNNYGGLGLGLWIVRRIVEAHGGTVSARSTQGQGATMTLRLPVHEVAHASASATAAAAGADPPTPQGSRPAPGRSGPLTPLMH
jgi:signal transduction histidine kinase